MAPDPETQTPTAAPSLWSAVSEVIQGLAKQPALLFGFGLAIILLAAGSLAFENLRLIALTLIGLSVVAFVAWIFSAALKRKTTPKPQAHIRSGGLDIASDAEVDKETELNSGSIDVEAPASANLDIRSGDVKVGKRAKIDKSKVGSGKVNVRMK